MKTLDLTDPKVMTVKKGGKTQMWLFSNALKNSSTSAEWRDQEVQFVKTIWALSLTTSKIRGNER